MYLLDTIKLGDKKETLTLTDDRYNAVAKLDPIIKNCFPNKYCCIPADLSTQIQRTAQRAFTWGGIGGTIGLVGGGLYGGYSDAKEYNNNKKAVAIRSFKETFDTLYPQIHSDKVKTEIIKSDCIHNTVRDSFQNWPTSRIFHTKRDDYCAQDDELGKILGEEMRQHNGNIMKAYPNAVDRFCYEKHNTDEIQEQAKNEAFPLAMEVAAQAMQSIPAPASFSWEKAGQGAMAGLGIGITAGTIYTIACTDDLTRPIKHTEIPNM